MLYCCNKIAVTVVVHGRVVGWVRHVDGWWMGRWVVLYLPAQRGGRMGGVDLVHRPHLHTSLSTGAASVPLVTYYYHSRVDRIYVST